MSLLPGTRLGPYEVHAAIGAGGMGEVYRATDTNLARQVALKVLPQAVASDPDRLARFEREAHTLAALNHPHIAAIYGLERSAGTTALVMELVEGPTLAERIAQGPIPLEEALPLAQQIAAALDAAHERGIVHRDLKPANIKVRPDGTVKVLDFGLAKALDAGRNPAGALLDSPARLTQSPTLSVAATQQGVILGTAAYMAPEQARGRPVDRRADIWAFGVVLYEMVTGRRLFEGEDLTDTLASVVKVDPDISGAPPQLRRLLAMCLAKDPKRRLRDIGDAWALVDLESPAAVAPAPAASRTAALVPWLAAAAGFLATAGLAVVHFSETVPELRAVQFAMEAPPETSFTDIYAGYAPSPDGRYVAFAARQDGDNALWLRRLDSSEARRLPGTDGANFPTWSPDSVSLAFVANGRLRRIDIAGGAPLTLADAPNSRVSPTGAWNRDGVILFGSAAGLQRASAQGGGATLLTRVDAEAGESGHGFPQFLSDGRRFLYFVASNDPSVQGVYVSSLDDPGQRQQLLRTSTKAVFVPPRAAYPGYLLWTQDQTLLAQRFDVDSLRREGDPIAVTEDIALSNLSALSAFWASDAGVLTYFGSPAGSRRQIVWMARDGTLIGDAVPEDDHSSPALSPDATRLAITRYVSQGTGSANQDIWIWDLARQTLTRLTFDAGSDVAPLWSPDGRFVAFASNRDGVWTLYRKEASGAGEDERLLDARGRSMVPLDWSRDGRYLLYRELDPDNGWDLLALPLEGDRQPVPLLRTPFHEQNARLSPDGRWLAFWSNETGRGEIYLQAFPAGADTSAPRGRWQISSDGAPGDLTWRDDGREIYYETFDGRVMAVAIDADASGVGAGTPRELFSADIATGIFHSFEATGDGERFVLLLNPRDRPDIRLTVVSNWQATLRR